jgi:hypothetical protein
VTMNAGPPPPPRFVDNPLAPDVFAEEAVGFFLLNGNVHITFATPRPNHDPQGAPHPINMVVIGRLIIPVPGAQALAAGLYDFLKQRGFDPAHKPTDPKAIQ